VSHSFALLTTRGRNRLLLGILLLAVIPIAGWRIRDCEPPATDLKEVATVELVWRYLWDPESPDLLEWQVLGDPLDLILGPAGDLFISDGDKAKVLRCRTDGRYIETIGRKGEGPGEFNECWDLAYLPTDSTLWVIDRSTVHGSISRFRVSPERTQFLNRFIAPNTWMQTAPNLVVEDPHNFWVHDRSRRAELRILRIGDDGEINRSFGETEPLPDIAGEQSASAIRGYNEGTPELIAGNRLIYVFQSRPVMELWSRSGNRLLQKEFDLPEIRSLKRDVERTRREMGRQDVYPVFFRNAIWHAPSHALYVSTAHGEKNQMVIYGMAPEDLSVRYRYSLPNEGADELFLDRLAIARGGLDPCFYMIDRGSFGIVVLEAASKNRVGRPER
jgi:hypothetical protein